MNWISEIAAWCVLAWFAMLVAIYWSSIGRCNSLVNKWRHALCGVACIAAIAIVWQRWNWVGIVIGIILWFGTLLVTAIACRMWLMRLLRTSPSAADTFMGDP
jgi:hypothetical protein